MSLPPPHDRELNKEAVLSAGDRTESTILLFDVMSGDNPSAFMWWHDGGSLTAKTTATLTAALTFPILWSLTIFMTRSWSRQTPSQLPVLVIWADKPKIDTAKSIVSDSCWSLWWYTAPFIFYSCRQVLTISYELYLKYKKINLVALSLWGC